MAGDTAGLAHCRVRGGPRLLRLPAGLHRRRAVLRRLRRGRLPRHPAGSAAAAAGLGLAVRARRSAWSARCSAGAILASGLEGVGVQAAPRRSIVPGLGLARRRCSGRCSAPRSALGIVWIAAAVAAQTPGRRSCAPTSSARRSCASSTRCCRRPGRSWTRSRGWTRCRRSPGPSPDVGAADAADRARLPGVRAASRSVVRVLGTACGLAIEGSGWVAAPDLVVTNAHVVAGEQDTTVEVGGDAPAARREPIAFDPDDDIAILRVRGPRAARAAVSRPIRRRARAGAILGYPENGPFDVEPARIGRTQTVLTAGRLRARARCRGC